MLALAYWLPLFQHALAAGSDINNDGKVDVVDLGILFSAWGPSPNLPAADLNQNGTVDVADLGILLSQWGTIGGSPAQTAATFTASSLSITAGQSVTLTWSASNANTCTASGGWSGSKALSGSQSVTPSQTTTYTLACSATGGVPVTKSLTVAISTNVDPGNKHAALVAAGQASFASDSRINCSKYPEKRIFLETQGWWMNNDSIAFPSSIPSDQRPEAQGTGGHAHTATCFPAEQKISGSGTMHFDVRLMLHKGNEAQVGWLDIGVGPGGESLARVNFNPTISCPAARDITVNCTFWVPIDLDLSKVPSGYQELRFRFNLNHPSGDRQFASTGWNAWYHGGTSTYRTPPWQEARGWWPDTTYTRARLLSTIPVNPVSGTIKLTIQASNATQVGLHVDAFFNANDFGEIIFEQRGGDFKGDKTIDTTKLSNGMHWVGILASKEAADGTSTGIFQFPIIVQN